MKLFLLLTVFCLHFVKTVSILCYRCDDSTDDKEIADCAYHVRTLAHQRYLLDTKERGIKELSYLKNCSNYVDDYGVEIFQFCKIEVIQSHGTTNGYLRDCSDGVNFASLNVTRLQNLNADNQSTCGFSQLQGATQCVQLCKGDFCNGPLSDGSKISLSVNVSIFYAVAGLIFSINRNAFW